MTRYRHHIRCRDTTESYINNGHMATRQQGRHHHHHARETLRAISHITSAFRQHINYRMTIG
jgi:hypothetical protein